MKCFIYIYIYVFHLIYPPNDSKKHKVLTQQHKQNERGDKIRNIIKVGKDEKKKNNSY